MVRFARLPASCFTLTLLAFFSPELNNRGAVSSLMEVKGTDFYEKLTMKLAKLLETPQIIYLYREIELHVTPHHTES